MDRPTGRLTGRVAFITGAGAGIARSAAELFADEGAQVALIEINEQAGISAEKAFEAGAMPAVFEPATRVDAVAAGAVSAAASAACDALAEDSAHTTLMVLEFQRWWRAQAGVE